MREVTHLLSTLGRGDPHAASQLLPLVYEELRKLAPQRMAQEQPGQTLGPFAMLHEAYFRLVGNNPDQRWNSRGHFLATAADAMRHIPVDDTGRN
jgi:hypothetical protein